MLEKIQETAAFLKEKMHTNPWHRSWQFGKRNHREV